jgi:hypothetical protein
MTKLKSKGGRRQIVLNDNQIKELEELARDMTIEQIPDYFGITEKTFRAIRDRNITVLTAYKRGKAGGIREATSLLWQKMRAGDTASILFYLKTQAGWSEKQQLDITTKDVTPQLTRFNIIVIDDASQSNN